MELPYGLFEDFFKLGTNGTRKRKNSVLRSRSYWMSVIGTIRISRRVVLGAHV